MSEQSATPEIETHGSLEVRTLQTGNLLAGTLRIGSWTVWPTRNRAERDGVLVHLEPKPMEVLAYLAARPGQVVSRRELSDAIWDETHVADGSLTLAISKLRKAFGESAQAPRLIETIAKRGYRLVAPVSAADEAPLPFNVAKNQAALELPEAPRAVLDAPRRLLPAAGWLLILLVGTAVWVTSDSVGRLSSEVAKNRPPQPIVHVLESRPLTTQPGIEAHAAVSPLGNVVAFVQTPNATEPTQLLVRSLADAATRRIPGSDGAIWPAFSPDGSRLAFARTPAHPNGAGCELMMIDLASADESEARRLGGCGSGPIWGLEWSKDDRSLVYSRQEEISAAASLVRLDLESLSQENLTEPPVGSLGDGYPRFSPDGSLLAFVRSRSKYVDELRLLNLRTGKERLFRLEEGPIRGITWNPQGDAVIYSALRQSGFSLWRLALSGGGPERVVLPYGQTVEPHLASGRLVVRSSRWQGQIHRLELASSTPEAPRISPWNPSSEVDKSPLHSPDGKSVVFASRRGGAYDLWRADASGENSRQITRLAARALGSASFSPDGERLVFAATLDVYAALYLLDLESGAVRRLSDGEWDDATPSFSLDGRHIYFASDRDGSWQGWRVKASGGRAERITRDGGYAPSELSERVIVYSKCGGGIFQQRFGENEERLFGTDGSWTIPRVRNGHIDFVRKVERGHELVRFNTETRRARILAELPATLLNAHLSWAQDDSELLFASHDEHESDLLVVEDFEL